MSDRIEHLKGDIVVEKPKLGGIKDTCLVVRNHLGTFTSIPSSFHILEAVIDDIYTSIQNGKIRCLKFHTAEDERQPMIIGKDVIDQSVIFLKSAYD